MCLRRAPEEYIAGTKAPAGAALDTADIDYNGRIIKERQILTKLVRVHRKPGKIKCKIVLVFNQLSTTAS
jgi:hypothetical protein